MPAHYSCTLIFAFARILAEVLALSVVFALIEMSSLYGGALYDDRGTGCAAALASHCPYAGNCTMVLILHGRLGL